MIKEKIDEILNISYKYRYYIALVILVICLLFELSGSSIGVWNNYGLSDVNDGVIFGNSRAVRSDEWAVLTPMTFSQYFDGFKYISSLIRGGGTDVFMVYGLPVLTLVQIYRPFQIGFLLLGISKGLSFFWCARFLALFLVSFEFMRLITDDKKKLSFVGAIMITLAPIIQWWFAVNGIVEIFVFGELLVLLLDKYMLTDSLKRRIGYLLAMIVCAGGYIMVLYPAWQICMAYVFGVVGIWTIAKNYKKFKFNFKDLIAVSVAIIIFVLSMLYIFSQSKDTLMSVMHTVYPGSRSEIGGGQLSSSLDYVLGPFLPFTEDGLNKNLSSKSMMYAIFPIGLILVLRNIIKEKNKDLLSILLLGVYVFFAIYYLVGIPEILSKISLLSKVTAKRLVLAIGLIDVLFLVRSLAIQKEKINKKISIGVSIVLALLIILGCKYFNFEYFKTYMMIISFVVTSMLIYFSCRFNSSMTSKNIFVCIITLVMIISGLFVNPLRSGVDNIYESSLTKEIQRINNEEYGRWITSGIGFPISNFILMAGVPVVNSTNVYPNMELWKTIDKEGAYEDVYNRYAHINIEVIENNDEFSEKFYLNQSDVFTVYLTPEELENMDVKYIFTADKLEKHNTVKYSFTNIYEFNNMYIYKFDH